KNIVAEGRDMTTVVFADAEKKFYLDASVEERARRRMKELAEAQRAVPFEQILADIKARDEKDMTRSVAPLRRAADAIYVDTSRMTIDEVVDRLLREIGG
ncbi:MAG: cytidylate kinase, partial [Planctomycetes bacterium]|nr:cytidylate kinase [Planctomycetota bacterium]